MEQLKPNLNNIAVKWAAIYLVTAIAITFVVEIAKIDPDSVVKYLSYIPLFAFLLLTQKEYKNQMGGYVNFGESFNSGFRYGLFSALFFAVFLYVYLTVISPEVFTKSIEGQRDAMAAKGLSAEQIDKGLEIAKKYGAILGAIFVIIWYLILTAIIALIGAAIFKNERSAFDRESSTIDPTV
ncbi:MAG: DUF4199 domain-containing protein [Mucilaginibacter sp.]